MGIIFHIWNEFESIRCLSSAHQLVRWAAFNLATMTKLGFLRLSYEKQDTLLKLLILSMAGILCECLYYVQLTCKQLHYSLIIILSIQRSPPDCFPSWGLKVSSMSLIRKCLLTQNCAAFDLPKTKSFHPYLLNYNCESPSGISTTAPPASWQKKDFITFIIGLMTEHGIHLGGSSVAPFILVGMSNNAQFQDDWKYLFEQLKKKKATMLTHVFSPPPGLMITSATLYHVLHFFHITIDIRNVCVFLAPLFSSFTAIVTYHFTKELKVISNES